MVGSNARTVAPASTKSRVIVIAGEPRRSPVFALNDSPNAATVVPSSDPPAATAIFVTTRRIWSSLPVIAPRTMDTS